jgi:acyl carrier protein
LTEAEAYHFLTRIFTKVFEREGIVLIPELSSRDVFGWDSFKQVELIIAIEESLSIRFKPNEVDDLQNVGDLARLVAIKSDGLPSGTRP